MKMTPVLQWRKQKETTELIGKTGTIVQWTMIRVPAKSFGREAPYPVVIVQMEKKRKIGMLVDWKPFDLQKGRNVIAVLRRTLPENDESIITYTIKFKPHESS